MPEQDQNAGASVCMIKIRLFLPPRWETAMGCFLSYFGKARERAVANWSGLKPKGPGLLL